MLPIIMLAGITRSVVKLPTSCLIASDASPKTASVFRYLTLNLHVLRMINVSFAGISRVPFVRWRLWLGIHFSPHGTTVGGLRQEEQASVLRLPRSASLDGGRRAVQLDPHHSHHSRALGLRVHGGQRGDLRHLPAQSVHRAAHLHEPEPTHRPDRVFDHRLAALRGCAQRGSDRVPGRRRPPARPPLFFLMGLLENSRPIWCPTRGSTSRW